MPNTEAKESCNPTFSTLMGENRSSSKRAAAREDSVSFSRPIQKAAMAKKAMITARSTEGVPPASTTIIRHSGIPTRLPPFFPKRAKATPSRLDT